MDAVGHRRGVGKFPETVRRQVGTAEIDGEQVDRIFLEQPPADPGVGLVAGDAPAESGDTFPVLGTQRTDPIRVVEAPQEGGVEVRGADLQRRQLVEEPYGEGLTLDTFDNRYLDIPNGLPDI